VAVLVVDLLGDLQVTADRKATSTGGDR